MELVKIKKDSLRSFYKKKLTALFFDADFRKEKSDLAVKKILESSEFQAASKILIFYPLDDELNLLGLKECPESLSKTFILPRVLGQGRMVFFEFKDLNELKVGKYGIKVPLATNTYYRAKELDLVIVPGLAFDTDAYRLGRGGGYYDRLLDQIKHSNIPAISIALNEQIVQNLPRETTDMKLNKLIII